MKTDMLFNRIAPATRSAPRARWMVVDDNELMADFLAQMLETLDVADVQRCTTGAEALAALSAAPDQFQFVITDLDMPGMNGIELCRQLHAVAPQLKIALATGNSDADERGVRRCGFCGLLLKPIWTVSVWRVLESAGVLDRTQLGTDDWGFNN